MYLNLREKKILGVDVDGVQRNMIDSLIETYSKTNSDGVKEHDEVREWDLKKSFPNIRLPTHFYEWAKPLFSESKPYEGALEFMEELSDIGKIHIVTNQLRGLEHHTLDWLSSHNIPYEGIHFGENKTVFKGDVLIDDHTKNIYGFQGRGILLDRPWNQDFRGYRVKSFDEIVDTIKNLS